MTISKRLEAIEAALSARRPPKDVAAVRATVEALMSAPWEPWGEEFKYRAHAENLSPPARRVFLDALRTFGQIPNDSPAGPRWSNRTPE